MKRTPSSSLEKRDDAGYEHTKEGRGILGWPAQRSSPCGQYVENSNARYADLISRSGMADTENSSLNATTELPFVRLTNSQANTRPSTTLLLFAPTATGCFIGATGRVWMNCVHGLFSPQRLNEFRKIQYHTWHALADRGLLALLTAFGAAALSR